MKQLSWLLILIISLSINGIAQKNKPSPNIASPSKQQPDKRPVTTQQIEVKYDEFRDETSVSLGPLPLTPSNTSQPIEMVILFNYPGKTLRVAPDSVFLAFTTYSRPTEMSMFSSSPEWNLIVDGQRERGGKLHYEVTASSGRAGKVKETLSMSVIRPFVETLASARQIRMQVGGIEFELRPVEISLIRELTGKLSEGLGDLTPILEIKSWNYATRNEVTRGEAVVFNPTKADIKFAKAVMNCQISGSVAGEFTSRYFEVKAGQSATINLIRMTSQSPDACDLIFKDYKGNEIKSIMPPMTLKH